MFDNKRCVLLVDDEVKMVRALKDLLVSKGFHILVAYNGEQALDEFYKYNTQIDIVLLDVMMPIYNGFEVLAEIRKSSSNVPVIMLTAKGEEYDQLKGFNLGIDDYIVKPILPTLLIARIETILKRVGKDSSYELQAKEITLNISKRTAIFNDKDLELKKREFDLLYFLIINKSIIFTREQLLDNVWGYDFEGDIRTVDTHIKQLRIKLEDKSSYIQTIYRVGYSFEI